MSKVTITLEDKPEDGPNAITMTAEFDPELKRDEPLTSAQSLALTMLQNVHKDHGTKNPEIE